jgi:hypothetical protein
LIGCPQGYIGCIKLDDAVWNIVCEDLLEPHILIESLDRHFTDGENATLLEQITFLETQIDGKLRKKRKYIALISLEHLMNMSLQISAGYSRNPSKFWR